MTAAPRKAPALRASARTSTGPPGQAKGLPSGGPFARAGSASEGRDHLGEAPDRLGALRVREAHDRRLHAGLGELAVAAHLLLGPRRPLPLARAARRHDPRRRQMCHLDLGRIALLRRAVLVEHGELVPHTVGVAAQVAGVGMPGYQPQGPLLPRPAHHDRDPLLQRPRIADGLAHRERPALEARRAGPPQERQQLERVLEPVEALGERREVPAIQLVLALEPGRAEPTQRPAAGEHVEGGQDLPEVGDVAVADPGHERAQPDALRHAGQVGERGVALEHVLPLPPDLGDLQEVVHHPQAPEAGLLRRAGNLRERLGRRGRVAREAEAGHLQAELERHRILLLPLGGVQGCQEGGRHQLDRPGAVHAGEALVLEPLEDLGALAQLAGHDLARDRASAGAVAAAHLRCGRVEHDGVGLDPVALGEPAPGITPARLEAGGVDHRDQPAPQPALDDEVEQLEGVAARTLGPLAGADHLAQPVGRDDLIRVEPLARPVRLPGRRRADEHDEARVGKSEGSDETGPLHRSTLKRMSATAAGMHEGELLDAARSGDERAFRRLVELHRRELHAHCYRMMGSLHDAEDALQDALLRAWRGLPRFEGRSSPGSWLYRIATNACLDAIARRPRRVLPIDYGPPSSGGDDPGGPLGDSVWIEPYPDERLALEDGYASPDARYERREAVELAFIAALQHLPARQRAVLILRDVLGFSAKEVGMALETTPTSVNSALQRARRTLDERLPDTTQQATLRALGDDAKFSMPPYPDWYRGREAISESWLMPGGPPPRLRYVQTWANAQPALATYCLDRESDSYLPIALDVLTLRRGAIAEVVAFRTPRLFPRFGLPARLG